jgi:hypothetical protein
MPFDPEDFNLLYVLNYQYQYHIKLLYYKPPPIEKPKEKHRKKKRRLKTQIKRTHKCDFLHCEKAYGVASHLITHKISKNH